MADAARVIFEDDVAGTREEHLRADLPEDVAYAEVDGQRVAVVRVVRTSHAGRAVIDAFDEAGNLVRRIVGPPR